MSIQARLVMAVAAAAAILGAASFALVSRAAARNAHMGAERAVSDSARALAAMEREDVERLDATLHALMAHPGIAGAFAARDRARLLALAAPIFEGLNASHDVTHWYFIDPAARTVFLRVHAPERHGDVVSRETLRKAIETRGRGAGKELGQTAFALRVVRPYHGPGGELLGYMELAEELDHFLGRMREQTGDDFGLLVDKRYIDEQEGPRARAGRRNDRDEGRRTVVVDVIGADESLVEFDGDLASLPASGRLLGEIERGGRHLARGIVPVQDAAGRQVGGLIVLREVTEFRETMRAARRSLAWVVAGVAVAFAVLLLLVVNRLVFARLARVAERMEAAAARLVAGDAPVEPPAPTGRDEIGRLERAFGRFLGVVNGLPKERGTRRPGG